MKVVQPIREVEKIAEIKSILKKENMRNYILFSLGIYSGLRISDIISLKIKDLKNKDKFAVQEQKTNKPRLIKIHDSLKEDLNKYLKDLPEDDYIFKSQKGGYIDRVQAYKILSSVAKRVGLDEIGTHTLRKTFGYHMYKKTNNLTLLQKILNHSSPDITLRYIGILQDDIDDAINSLDY